MEMDRKKIFKKREKKKKSSKPGNREADIWPLDKEWSEKCTRK
jgi:hypothetical protein